MVKYELSKIYKIVDNTNGNVYIGSTCEPTLARRLAGHRNAYKNYLNGKGRFVTSFLILKNDNYEIVLLEQCKDITSKDQLHKRERFFIENNTCVNIVKNVGLLNELGKTEYQKVYYEENKDKKCEYQKVYYEENKDKKYEYQKVYNEEHKEKNREYQKKYYKENKDKINANRRKYRQKNKDKINEC